MAIPPKTYFNKAAISSCSLTEQQTRSALKILKRFPGTANALYEEGDNIMLVISHGVSGQAPTHRTIFLIDDEGLYAEREVLEEEHTD